MSEAFLGPMPVDRASALPLWAQVHADLQRRLRLGAFEVAFPGELALVAEYGVSRHTIREALRRMRTDGQVVAERGRAPRLAAAASIDQPLGAMYSLFSSVEAAGLTQRSIVRALEVRVDVTAASQLELPANSELVYLERLRLADGEPLALDRTWLPADLARPLLAADFAHTALYAELFSRCGVRPTSGEETIRAVVPTGDDQELLEISAGAAALEIHRRSRVEDRLVEWRLSLVRGDRFSVSAQFSDRNGYRLGLPTSPSATAPDPAAQI